MANQYTTNLNLEKPAKGDADWDDEFNDNMDILDAAVGSEHSAEGKHKNTINVGDNANTDKKIVAHTGEAYEPYLIYDASKDYFSHAPDGVNEKRLGEYIGSANILYVATDGNDTSGDGTIQRPYQTIAKVITEASSGDLILIFPGTYDQAATMLTVNKAVYILGLGSREAVKITGAPAEGHPVIWVSAAAKIENLTIEATGSGNTRIGLEIRSPNIICRRLHVDNNATGTTCHAIGMANGTGVVLEDCVVESLNGVAIFIDIGDGGSGGATFRRVRGVSVDSVAVTLYNVDCDDMIFEDCYFESGGADGDYGILFHVAVTGTVIRNCTIKGETAGGDEESIHADAAMTAAIYQCSLNHIIDADITNSIATPYNVNDSSI